jgi:drug/metabolite transporter (DMT)-like permease
VADAIPPATLAFFRWAVACIALAPFAWKPLRRDWPQLRRNAGYLALTASSTLPGGPRKP